MHCYKNQKILGGTTKFTRKPKASNKGLADKDVSHIVWWKETDDLNGRVRAHCSKDGMQTASFLYFIVPGKSIARQLETLVINQLLSQGFPLPNPADGKHQNFGTSSLSLGGITVPQHV